MHFHSLDAVSLSIQLGKDGLRKKTTNFLTLQKKAFQSLIKVIQGILKQRKLKRSTLSFTQWLLAIAKQITKQADKDTDTETF